ncbi:MAG TPA: tail fiber domain-containing protein, partial [Candidatus Saccharimonadales bacterium]
MGYNVGNGYNGSESNNVLIQNYNNHVTGESNTLRIGNGTGTGVYQFNQTFIAGIQTIGITGTPVLVSSSDQLGVAPSSVRFKENIQDMNDFSSPMLNLRPVSFTYKEGEDKSPQPGFIAEEVAQVMPSMVVYDKEGVPFTVKYHEMPAMLLNELQKALKRIEALEAQLKG